MLIKNIEAKIRLATFIAGGSFLASVIITCITSTYAYKQVTASRKNVYILDNNVPILAKQTDVEMNRPAEYRAHVDLFHSLFFSLAPDDKYIEYQLKKA